MSEHETLKAPMEEIARAVRQKRAEAVEPMPPRPPGCPVCRCWRLRDGEARHEDGHVTGCPMARRA